VRLPPRTVSTALGLALFLVVVLLPRPARLPDRDLSRDLEALQQTECEYRGITATFRELTRAYVLETYAEGELLRWDAELSPRNPDSETLVTAVFRVGSAKPVINPVVPDSIIALRTHSAPQLRVSWRYSSLASVRINAANDFARDALAVFRLTVDRFIGTMVVTRAAVRLRDAPAADASTIGEAAENAVLLLAPHPSATPVAAGWSYVRIPSTATQGWVRTDRLIVVEDEH
jgi:hypothetical protein